MSAAKREGMTVLRGDWPYSESVTVAYALAPSKETSRNALGPLDGVAEVVGTRGFNWFMPQFQA